VLNLAHNPETSAGTAAALIDVDRRPASQLTTLIRLAIGPTATEEMVTLVFHALRGLAVSHLIQEQTAPAELAGKRQPGNLPADAGRLALALARLIGD
jgi:hypothetical protein